MADEITDPTGQGGGTQTGEDKKSSEEKSGTQTEETKSSEETTGEGKKDDKTFTQADINRMLAKERKEWEKKTQDAEARAKLSEEERTKAEMADLRNQLKERDARDSVTNEATKPGVKNPRAAYRLVKDDLEFDDKGSISNLKEVFESVKADFPELFGDAKPKEGIDAGAGSKSGTTTLTKEKIEKMSQSELIANMNEINKFLRTQK